jgi:hypothetical protein
MPRLLLLIPTTSYRTKDFLSAAIKAGVDVTVGSNDHNVLSELQPEGTLTIDFNNLNGSVKTIKSFNKRHPVVSIIGVDEQTCLIAVKASKELKLPHNSYESVKATCNKYLFRKTLKNSGLLTPNFQCLKPGTDVTFISNSADYPCILKPVNRSASQGVIRVNNQKEFQSAFQRITSLAPGEDIIMEDFLPGEEVSLEGILRDGKLTTFAIFDKPDPLDGPFFEETIYITPSQHPASMQDALHNTVQDAANALGIKEGPVHAELRLRHSEPFANEKGPWLIELATRSIGGLCSRSLTFNGNHSLEDLIIAHALQIPLSGTERENTASGVMMIPIPTLGILKSVEGEIEARRLKHVTDIQISIKTGQKVIPLPEGNQYLGFIFAKADTPRSVEETLREAHSKLTFNII